MSHHLKTLSCNFDSCLSAMKNSYKYLQHIRLLKLYTIGNGFKHS
jgi:hypothetical protein